MPKQSEAEKKAKARERAKRWQKKNPEKARANQARWRSENPEKSKEYKARYRAKNREKVVEKHRQYNDTHRGTFRGKHLKRRYGLTEEQWDAMFESQGCACAVCKTTVPNGKGWHTDHCHTAGSVRGVLCYRCNVGIGYFKDDPARLNAAAAYIEHSRAPQE